MKHGRCSTGKMQNVSRGSSSVWLSWGQPSSSPLGYAPGLSSVAFTSFRQVMMIGVMVLLFGVVVGWILDSSVKLVDKLGDMSGNGGYSYVVR